MACLGPLDSSDLLCHTMGQLVTVVRRMMLITHFSYP